MGAVIMVIVYLSVALVFVFWAYLAITDLSWGEPTEKRGAPDF